jgi:hypothetical protein
LLDAAYCPSLWRVWGITLRVVLIAVIGSLALDHLLRAGANVHRRLAHAGRKRKPQVRYPVRG